MSNISYFAIKTIFIYEVKDFFKEFQFNIVAPLINTLLFVIILSTIESYYSIPSDGGSYLNFLVPGIIIMVVMQASFNHLSEVIIAMKQIGSFNDYLMSPISRIEIFFSLILSSLVVCVFIGMINLTVLTFFTNFQDINYFRLFYYLVISIIIYSSIGAVTGFLSFTWDAQSTVSNFVIVPISLLSGTFFSIDSLDNQWKIIFEYNPFYHLVSGFRGAFIENSILNANTDILVTMIAILTFLISLFIFNKGYKVIY